MLKLTLNEVTGSNANFQRIPQWDTFLEMIKKKFFLYVEF